MVGKPEGKRPLERRRRKWEVILKRFLKEMVLRAWNRDRWHALVKAEMNLRVP